MNTTKKFIVFILMLLASVIAKAQQSTQLSKALSESIEKRISSGNNPSIAIGIIDKNGPQYFNFGKTGKVGTEVNEHTIYEIGSITKVFTAILLAQQSIGGKVGLTDPIDKYLVNKASISVIGDDKITLANLSDHTSGLPRMPDNFTPENPENPFADYTDQQLYAFLSSYKASRKVGDVYEYSNLAQGLLGNILAKNTNQSYESLMIDQIASPLALKETKIKLDPQMQNRLAIGHRDGKEVENWDIVTLAGAGAIRSSTHDMLKFLSANLGLTNTSLKPAMDMTHQVRHNKAGGESVGLGWHIKKGRAGEVLWHNGGTGGYRAFAGFNKAIGKGVVVLTNSTTSVDDIGLHLLDASFKLTNKSAKSDAVDVAEDILERYVGNYELTPTFAIAVTRQGKQLYIQATGQQRFEVYAKNNTDFFLTVVEADITFQEASGKVESLTLYQAGQVIVGKKTD